MHRRLFQIALNPFFQALVVALLIIIFVPLGVNKFFSEQVAMSTSFDQTRFEFADLDHDGHSERIQTFHNLSGNAGIALVKGIHTIGQWNFRGTYMPGCPRAMTGNYDRDEFDEIYIITLSEDSILLHGLAYSPEPELFVRNRFISLIGKSLKDPDFVFYPGEVTDMTGDGSGDLVFAISAGHSRQPRNVFIYDLKNDSLYHSPYSGAFINSIKIENLDGDMFPEILLSTYASSNYNNLPVAYSDTSSWIMVLDHDLTFRFPPIEFPGPTGGTSLHSLKSDSGYRNLICASVSGSLLIKTMRWSLLSPDGHILKEKFLDINNPENHIGFISRSTELYNDKILGVIENDGFVLVDSTLNRKRISKVKTSRHPPSLVDIDQDGEKEIILLSPDHKTHKIYRKDFSNPVAIDFPVQSTPVFFSVKLNGKDPPQLSVQGDREWKLFDYGINPAWRFRFLVWLGIYLAVLGFIVAIRQLYSLQLKKRYETEKKIATLQLSSVKAQMEPHFIMNTINTIGSSIYRQKPDEAYNLLLNFSGMVRSLLMSSDKLTRSLKEEIEFARNYLELEKTRFGDIFNYTVTVAEGINPEAIIPKMIIQLHTENALKHGLLPKKSGGVLDISIRKEHDHLVITITDNGIGRNMAAKNISQSTGKGMKILNQFFETYNKHNKNHLRQEINDLYDDDRIPAGTQVKIYVPVDFNEGIF